MTTNQPLQLGTKAETLARLQRTLNSGRVLDQFRFTQSDWQADSQRCLSELQKALDGPQLIVRSSALAEDSASESMAGAFCSIGGVDASDPEAVSSAIEQVIASFETVPNQLNQVLVQPFLQDIAIAGVAFTREMDQLSPYMVVNYDDQSHTADSITSGRTNSLKTLVKLQGHPTGQAKFETLFKVLDELMQLFACDHLDVEFAIDSKATVYVLQVRPLVTQGRFMPPVTALHHYLRKVAKKINKLNQPYPGLFGERTIFGVMPDWNPAEIVGIKPRPLALSLYQQLVTNRVWAYQRDNYGYKNLRSFPLMPSFLGLPYIDVRVSLNSFLPAGLSEELSSKLADFYLEKLVSNPHAHDKLEFDVVFSCYFLNLDERLRPLSEHGFSEPEIQEIHDQLKKLTKDLFQEGSVFWRDLEKIEELPLRQKRIEESNLGPLDKIYWLTEDCKRYGTLPFAGLARAAFIAVQLLRSMVEVGILSAQEFDGFMAGLHTVAKEMNQDLASQPKAEFLDKYGHLRPGTYDILSLRYDENWDLYFGATPTSPPPETEPFVFSEDRLEQLDRFLEQEGLGVSASGLLEFCVKAIEGREYAKFIFTRSVSEILRQIEALCAKYGISREQASYLHFDELLTLYYRLDHRDLDKILSHQIAENQEHFKITNMIQLPPLLCDAAEVYEFHLIEDRPNFVTNNRCRAEVLPESRFDQSSLEGKIVLIESADPGYDWIFSKSPGGLITKFGGRNSHMAIRAAELGLPAVIGAGETRFREWVTAQVLDLDCENQQVSVVRA